MENKLTRLPEFQALLESYKVSEAGKQILAQTELILFAGVTSSGRNAIAGELLKSGNYHFVTSDTTRKPRKNHGEFEKNGDEYWFKTEEEFIEGLKNGEYLEAAIIHNQQVSGISLRELEIARDQKKIAITDIEIVGVKSIVDIKPDTICCFIIPPSFEIWQKRLRGRGMMTSVELTRRLRSAERELKAALEQRHFTIIVNDEFHKTTKVIENIHRSLPDQEHARTTARHLLMDTETFLKNI